jgi:hypothetical protein
MLYTPILLIAIAAIASANGICDRTTVAGYCETISYTDLTTTSPSPPSVDDCHDTCNGLFGDAGDWGCDLVGTSLRGPSHWFISSTNPRQVSPTVTNSAYSDTHASSVRESSHVREVKN